MELWQIALILLALVWALQAVGTFFQMRHFQALMGSVTDKWSDGRVGAGNAKGRFAKGVIALVVVDPQDIVRKVMVMEGRSVFAKFAPLTEWEGRPLAALRDALGTERFEAGRRKALANALEQIDRVAAKPAGSAHLAEA